MENAHQLFQAGRLKEAVQALSAELRNNPSDTRRRSFLFELLCFSGEYERAAKQLDVLAEAGPNSEIGALLYRSALQAERTRQDLFQKKEYPKPSGGASSGAETVTGTLNGKPFQTITDADPRIGPRLRFLPPGTISGSTLNIWLQSKFRSHATFATCSGLLPWFGWDLP